jgi:mRNA interferase YafQ
MSNVKILKPTSQFKKDFKRFRNKLEIETLLKPVLDALMHGKPLDAKYRDHALKGGYAGCHECHLKPDLLLIYADYGEEIRLHRLGSHSELFV